MRTGNRMPALKVLCLGLLLLSSVMTAQKPEAKTYTILIKGFKFTPDKLQVNAGDTVIWKNEDIVPHTATAVGKKFDSKSLDKDQSWKYVAKSRGSFPYICTFHPTMTAELTVK